jgi:hypothetical protein
VSSGQRTPRHTSPRAGAAALRRRRLIRTSVGVVLAVGLIGAVGYAGTHLLSGAVGDVTDTGPSEPAPLLPGAPTVTAPPKEPAATAPGVGYDVSYPQCGRSLPAKAAFGIVGINGGAPLTSNKCFGTQFDWARGLPGRAVYINTSWSGRGDPVEYGRRLVTDAIERERAAGVRGVSMWWLDVELANTWNGTQQENATVLDAMAAQLQEAGVRVGIYSSPAMWAEIAGDWSPGLPVWNATGPGTRARALASCSESFAGSTSGMVQWVQKSGTRLLDHNEICPAWKNRAGDLLDLS